MRKLFSLSILILTVFVFIITGCQSQDPLQPNQQAQELSGGEWDFAKRPIRSANESVSNGYPQSASLEIVWFEQQNGYSTGNLNFVNGTKLYVPFNALTPPSGTPPGDPVMITGLIEKDEVNNELIYSFGPSGCQFNPPADLWMKYGDLGNGNPTLYYIDANGNYIEQQPNDINKKQKWMQIKIHHFSRYAIGISR
jgi:hypothetical protein